MTEEVYKIDKSEDDFVLEVKNLLLQCDNGNNPDLVVVFKGYMHNKSGFKYRVENLESFDANLFNDWRQIIQDQGMQCVINTDLSNSWVDIKCKKVLRHRKNIRSSSFLPTASFRLPNIPFSAIAYLCLILSCIYILWIRHNERLVK